MLGVPLPPPPHGPSQSPTVYKAPRQTPSKLGCSRRSDSGDNAKKCEQETQQEAQFRAALHYLNDWNRLL